MEHINLLKRIADIRKQLNRMVDERPSCLDVPVDSRFIALLDEAVVAQKELAVLMRGTFHDRPDELAKWEKQMRRFRETEADDFLEALRLDE